MPQADVLYSCVVDADERFLRQASIWLTTLRRLALVPSDAIVVHLVDRNFEYGGLVATLDAQGIAHRRVAPFGDGRFCNKLRALESPEVLGRDATIFTDADIAWAGTVAWDTAAQARARVVDGPNVPLAVLDAVYAAAGRADRPRLVPCGYHSALTYADYCNGGVYALPVDLILALRDAWPRRAQWLLDRPHLLGVHQQHADQVSFALAMHDLGATLALLPPELNFPTHFRLHRYDPACAPPLVLHHHGRLDEHGRIRHVGLPQVDERIDRANGVLPGVPAATA